MSGAADARIEHFDVLIIGAGLSGIAAAAYLQKHCPDKRYAVLEARERIGGTWDLFRYPGVRSDSDMQTLGYSFRPWDSDRVIADGAAIRDYIEDTAEELGISSQIRYQCEVQSANFDSLRGHWTLQVRERGELRKLRCSFVMSCTGYYDYERGYQPDFAGAETFQGPIVHPQHWPESLELKGKRVVVIGSGATAVTLGPSLGAMGAQVTQLQRSPSYVMSLPIKDPIAAFLRKLLPKSWAHRLTRYKNISLAMLLFQLCRRFPNFTRRFLRKGVRGWLGPDGELDPHFSPKYAPWDERLCMVPDGDLFRAIRRGQLQMVTDEIDRFTASGIRLQSGRELPADVIVSATGLTLKLFGGIQTQVDGRPIDPAQCATYRGMMLSGVPNLVFAVGYTNATWTLKCELSARFACRVIRQMDRQGAAVCVAEEPEQLPEQPLIDLQSGYVARSWHLLPRQGTRAPWRLYQNYLLDWLTLRLPMRDGALRFLPGTKTPDSQPATERA